MNPGNLPEPTWIDLLRHGEPAGGDRYRGSLDDPLSPNGWAQMRQSVDHRPGGNAWQVVVSSPLRRCADFARALATESGIPLIIANDFREMSFGAWEGKTAAEILAEEDNGLVRFWQDPLRHPPPGGEPLPALIQRVTQEWEGMVAQHEGGSILIVTHGGVIRALLSHLLKIPPEYLSRLLVPYAGMTRLRLDRMPNGTMPRLFFHGGPGV